MSSPIAQNAAEEIAHLVASVTAQARHNIDWYQQRKRAQRRWYYTSSVVVLVSGALIPALSAVPGDASRIATAVCGVLVVITTGLASLFRWHLNWVQYTAAQNQLEALFLRWELEANRLHTLTEDEQLIVIRRLCDQFVSELQTVRRTETVATLPVPKTASEESAPTGVTGTPARG